MFDPSLIYKWCENRGVTEKEWTVALETKIEDLYKIYEIKQGRKGKRRIIEEPIPELKRVQQALISLFERFELLECCMARKGRGIGDNADIHADAQHILRIDIKKCYPSITEKMIINTINNKNVLSNTLQKMMVEATTFCTMSQLNNLSNAVLPTGAPTSPILCNIALTPIDEYMLKFADQMGYRYTRYIDDLIFSTTKEKRDWGLIDIAYNGLAIFDLQPNKRKTKWMTRGHKDKMIVTGVSVGKGNRVPRDFKRMVRAKLNNLAKEGLDIDQETHGCLAYIKSIDLSKYESLITYYQRRQERWAV